MEYFSGHDIGYAIEIGSVNRFEPTLCLKKKFGLAPPQSFIYIQES